MCDLPNAYELGYLDNPNRVEMEDMPVLELSEGDEYEGM